MQNSYITKSLASRFVMLLLATAHAPQTEQRSRSLLRSLKRGHTNRTPRPISPQSPFNTELVAMTATSSSVAKMDPHPKVVALRPLCLPGSPRRSANRRGELRRPSGRQPSSRSMASLSSHRRGQRIERGHTPRRSRATACRNRS